MAAAAAAATSTRASSSSTGPGVTAAGAATSTTAASAPYGFLSKSISNGVTRRHRNRKFSKRIINKEIQAVGCPAPATDYKLIGFDFQSQIGDYGK